MREICASRLPIAGSMLGDATMKASVSSKPPDKILELIDRFGNDPSYYKSSNYNEAQVRQEFIDPFFSALGWDLENSNGWAPAYKDVILEDSIKIDGKTKAPDYSFRIGGTRKFFLEAKKPLINVKEDPKPAYQLRRYAWSAKLSLSVLTDFEEFSIYDARVKPSDNDSAGSARIFYTTFDQYENKWAEIAHVFARESILNGSFDKFAESNKHKRGTIAVDDAFLDEIEDWRENLAHNLVLRNRSLVDVGQINYAVQVILDRIIFLRICEDRGIEEYGQLNKIAKSAGIYDRLLKLFRRADDRYNSGLFHFEQEKGRKGDHDTLTPNVKIDDLTLRSIIAGMYYPHSPYEFSVIPSDLLGHVYEQFLGKVIVVNSARKVVVEKKTEVRKAGGVYYTPSYVVDYMVNKTIGGLLEGKTIKQADRVRILDPACGSGSFLLSAYQFLLDWYKQQYSTGPPKGRKEIYPGPGGEWRLTTSEKRRILLNSIYGVDIDPQAVEITKMSLLLKVLEGESAETLSNQNRIFQERALPDLDANIKNGNALIGPDIYDLELRKELKSDDHARIRPFDWEDKFPWITEELGFDVVIGNPPYLNIDDVWGKNDQRQRYIKQKYSDIYNDKTDILFYFFAKAIELSRGEVCFIVSRAFLEAFKADKLRSWISKRAKIREIIDFRNHHVFEGVGIATAIVAITKLENAGDALIHSLVGPLAVPANLERTKNEPEIFQRLAVKQIAFGSDPWLFAEHDIEPVLKKIDAAGVPLAAFLSIGQGMQTGCNTVFGGLSDDMLRRWGVRPAQRFERVRNSDIQRYRISESSLHLLYLEDVKSFDDLPAALRVHLLSHEEALKIRAAFVRGNCEWWRYTWPLHKDLYRRRKIFCPYLAKFNRFAIDETNRYLGLTDTTVIFDSGQPEDLRYIVAILNSKLLTFRFRYLSKLKGNGIIEYFENNVGKIPIRRIDFQNVSDKSLYHEIIDEVNQITELGGELSESGSVPSKDSLIHRINAADRRIDGIVYKLYGMNALDVDAIEKKLLTPIG